MFCFVVATVGIIFLGAVDLVLVIVVVVVEAGVWVHVDVVWVGLVVVCLEFCLLLVGLEVVDSYVFNFYKWLLTNFDCMVFYVVDC